MNMMKINKINVAKFPFFYGYVILFSGTIGILISVSGQTVGISVFTDFIIRDLKITRENLSLAYLIGTLSSSFVLTYAGRFFDKFGARITSVLAGFFLGLSLLFIAKVGLFTNIIANHWQIGSWSSVVFVLITIAFFMVRFFGQGVLTMSSKNMVMKWFEKRRGMASAIMGIAISFGFSYAPRLFDLLISYSGWQNAWIQIAIISGIFFTLFAAITFRDNPREYGLIPDGKGIIHNSKNKPKYHPDKQYTLKEARATYSFWIFTLVLSLQALYLTALTFNIVNIFADAGLTREDAIMIFLPSSIVAVLFQVVGGYLADFIKIKYLLMVQLIGMILSMSGLSMLSEGLPVYLVIIGNGISGGLFGVVSSVMWPRFYGIKHLGAITGYNMSWIVAGSALGPYLFSLLYDFSGNYNFAGLINLFIASILFVLSFRADNVNEIKVINKS
jgi:MFS family permease